VARPRIFSRKRLGTTLGVAGFAVLIGAASVDAGPIDGVGVIGNSFSDEYRYQGDLAAHRNWTEQLGADPENQGDGQDAPYAAFPQLNLGHYSTSTRDDGRDEGYRFNWAQPGARTYHAVQSSPTGEPDPDGDGPNESFVDQLWGADGPDEPASPGVAGHIEAGQVDTAVVALGFNDFGGFSAGQPYFDIYHDADSGERADVLTSNVEAITKELKRIGTDRTVLINVPDWNATPRIRNNDDFDDPQKRQRVADAVDAVNERIEKIGNDHDVPVVDFHRLMALGNGQAADFNFAGVSLRQQLADDAIGGPSDFWADRNHPGTIAQSMLANSVATALHEHYGLFDEDELLDDQSVLDLAFGLQNEPVPNADESLARDNFDFYGQFVVPAPQSLALLMGGLLILIPRRRREWRPR